MRLQTPRGIRPTAAAAFGMVVAALAMVLAHADLSGNAGTEPPAQDPLLSRAGGNVKPNVMITLDDSGSMLFQVMPEVTARIGIHSIPMAWAGGAYFDPSGMGPQASAFFLVSGIPASGTWQQRFLRSPDANTIYYNPEIRYLPWIRADGTRYPQAIFTAARNDPDKPTAEVDLSMVGQVKANWCWRNEDPKPAPCGTVEAVTQAYDAALWYRLQTDGGTYRDPKDPSSYVEYSANTQTRFIRHPKRSDCLASTHCTQAEERQNFANWFVYYRSRALLAKGALAEAMAPLDDLLRVGWGRLSKPAATVDGMPSVPIIVSGVRDWGNVKAGFYDWLLPLKVGGGTPLRLAVQTVALYYSSTAAAGPWSDTPGINTKTDEKACRRAYHLMITDGYWNDDNAALIGNVDGNPGPVITGPGNQRYQYLPDRPYMDSVGNTLADHAMKYWVTDLRPDLPNKVAATPSNPAFWQHMTNHIVGLGVLGTLDPAKDLPALANGAKGWSGRNVSSSVVDLDRIDDLWHAALNSRGSYFSARDPAELASAVQSAFRSILERDLREAGVATASSILEADNRKYVPRYRTGSWSGDVEAYVLDAKGQAGALAWSARDQLPPWGERNIVTWDAGASPARGVAFQAATLSAAAKSAFPQGRAESVIDYVRGDRSAEDAVVGLRVRDSVLGDVINSTPVYARAGADPDYYRLPGLGGAYARYVANTKSARDGVVYIGANDGMLHAFRETRAREPRQDGKEIFAYVPQAVHAQLAYLAERAYGLGTTRHRYFVDGPLREADVYIGDAWRNWLLGSTGAGARAVFAIDITDPTALGPGSVRWEISAGSHPELGYVSFPIETGMLPNGKWVALFGNGYGGASGQAVLFVVELATGAVQQVAVGSPGNNGLGGVAIARHGDGSIASVYAGDQQGRLWRFDPTGGSGFGFTAAVEGRPLFDAGTGKPIVQPPVLFQQGDGDRFVVFGSGRLLTESDAANTAVQTLYGYSDRLSESSPDAPKAGWTAAFPKGPELLQPRTIRAIGDGDFLDLEGDAIDWSRHRGWKIDLVLAGQSGLRVTYPPQKANDRYVFIGAVAPVREAQACDFAQGTGINLLFPALDGLADSRPVFDVDRNGVIDSADRLSAGYATSADGQDRIVLGATTATSGDVLRTQVSIQNTTGQATAMLYGRKPPAPTIKDRIWRRIANPPIR